MKHSKKMIAPIVITILLVLYYAILGILFARYEELPHFLRILCIAGPLLCALILITVCISRIKEIRSGEEDDLSQY